MKASLLTHRSGHTTGSALDAQTAKTHCAIRWRLANWIAFSPRKNRVNYAVEPGLASGWEAGHEATRISRRSLCPSLGMRQEAAGRQGASTTNTSAYRATGAADAALSAA